MMNFKSRAAAIFLCLVFALCIGLGIIHLKTDRHAPMVGFFTDQPLLGPKSPMQIRIAGSSPFYADDIKIYAVQGRNREEIAPANLYWKSANTLHISATLEHCRLMADGETQIEVHTRSGRNKNILGGILAPFWSVDTFTIMADLTPPQCIATLHPPVVMRGAPALLTVEAGEELNRISYSIDGTKYELEQHFPLHYASIAAFPHYMPVDAYRISIKMSDKAGNVSTIELNAQGEDFAFRDDPINIGNAFLQNKKDEFAGHLGQDLPPLELFLAMNREVRKESYKKLLELCSFSSTSKNWEGAFLEMPNATRRSEFADNRTYLHNGEIIDNQTHLGLDYASVVHDGIPAANGGIVRFAGYLGIHGNAVLVDHGLGIFSLYSHLSEIHAQKGDRVNKGDIVGLTGTSGMAGGDHLHFEFLIRGVSVNPDFLYNDDWVRKNIDEPYSRLSDRANEKNAGAANE